MITLTKAQRRSVKDIFNRESPVIRGCNATELSYREFRKTLRRGPYVDDTGPGCVMIRWEGMWLGIEPDGYTHS